MSPKFNSDEDGDTPPCGICDDIHMLEKWEAYKNKKHGTHRKAPCACRHFEGKVPNTHICTPLNKTKPSCLTWIKSVFCGR